MRYILLGFVAIIVFLVGFSYFLPAEIEISKSMTFSGNSKLIEESILDLKQWESWNEWQKMDSTLNLSYGEKDSGIGGRIYWGHKDKKENSIEIINAKNGEFIEFNLVWNNGADFSPGMFKFEPNTQKDSTKVTLTHKRELGNNPIARLMGGMANNIFDEKFKTMLNNLKKVVANKRKLMNNKIDTNNIQIATPIK